MQRNAETIKRTRSRYRQCNSSANLCVAASLRQISTLFKRSLRDSLMYSTSTRRIRHGGHARRQRGEAGLRHDALLPANHLPLRRRSLVLPGRDERSLWPAGTAAGLAGTSLHLQVTSITRAMGARHTRYPSESARRAHQPRPSLAAQPAN